MRNHAAQIAREIVCEGEPLSDAIPPNQLRGCSIRIIHSKNILEYHEVAFFVLLIKVAILSSVSAVCWVGSPMCCVSEAVIEAVPEM